MCYIVSVNGVEKSCELLWGYGENRRFMLVNAGALLLWIQGALQHPCTYFKVIGASTKGFWPAFHFIIYSLLKLDYELYINNLLEFKHP